MAKKGVIKYISFMFLLITTLIAIFTLFGLFGGTADPAKGTAMAMLVYILPFLIAGNIITAVCWAIRRRWHWMAIPVVSRSRMAENGASSMVAQTEGSTSSVTP